MVFAVGKEIANVSDISFLVIMGLSNNKFNNTV